MQSRFLPTGEDVGWELSLHLQNKTRIKSYPNFSNIIHANIDIIFDIVNLFSINTILITHNIIII